MARYGLDNFNEAGELIFSTDYPCMSLLTTATMTGTDTPDYGAQVIDPLGFCMPQGLNQFCSPMTTFFNDQGERANQLRVLTVDRNGNYVNGVPIKYGLFKRGATRGFDDYGLRTFSEDGVLTFDSSTPFLEVTGIAAAGDWVYVRRYGPNRGNADWSYIPSGEPFFYAYIYEVTLPQGTEFALVDTSYMYFANLNAQVFCYCGHDQDLTKFALMARVVSTNPNNPPTASLKFPTVIFGRASP